SFDLGVDLLSSLALRTEVTSRCTSHRVVCFVLLCSEKLTVPADFAFCSIVKNTKPVKSMSGAVGSSNVQTSRGQLSQTQPDFASSRSSRACQRLSPVVGYRRIRLRFFCVCPLDPLERTLNGQYL